MAGNKYVKVGTGGLLEEQASSDTSAGVADAGKIAALNSSGVLDPTLLPPGVAVDTVTATAFEALIAGDLVYIRSDGQVAKAIATGASTLAMGFVLAAVSAAASATVYLDTRITGLSGLTPGARYFLSAAAAGTMTLTAPTTAGQYAQEIGRALSATVLSFEAAEGILRA
jgi:hypothetical protein